MSGKPPTQSKSRDSFWYRTSTIIVRINLPLIGRKEFLSGTEPAQADCTIIVRGNLPLIASQEFLYGTQLALIA